MGGATCWVDYELISTAVKLPPNAVLSPHFNFESGEEVFFPFWKMFISGERYPTEKSKWLDWLLKFLCLFLQQAGDGKWAWSAFNSDWNGLFYHLHSVLPIDNNAELSTIVADVEAPLGDIIPLLPAAESSVHVA